MACTIALTRRGGFPEKRRTKNGIHSIIEVPESRAFGSVCARVLPRSPGIGNVMARSRSRSFLRPAGIVLMTTLGALLIGDGGSATAGTASASASGRMAQMRRAGCCCATMPTGGCCCEPAATAAPPHASGTTRSAVREISRTSSGPELARTGSRCECRADDPAVPAPGPGRRDAGRGIHFVRNALEARSVQAEIARAAVLHPIGSTAPLPAALSDLRTTHLLI
jgi:hypothetical protein